MMILSKENISKVKEDAGLLKPADDTLNLPEKVLQFGTGVLLRGLPDFIINNANRKGLFNGRIVIVKSTSTGGTDSFEEQNSLYTVCIRGVQGTDKKEENHLVTAVSRVLAASSDWKEILACAANPEMQVIISNTTELGIVLTKDNVRASPPQSFPGKLLAFLYQRYKIFNKDPEKGMVIIPTELIPDNGEKLQAIVLELAHQNGFEIEFIEWLENANQFCNSLVDRIVPGKFDAQEQTRMENILGYKDDLMIMSEPYALWAIESGDARVKEVLSFADAESGVVIAPDINKFRELKLRLLNGSHTFTCGLASLAGFATVKEAMVNEDFSRFIRSLMEDAIIPSITGDMISEEDASAFAGKVLDRYRNPFIQHQWLSICVQYSSKMQMRNVALIEAYEARYGEPSPLMALGMAAHILFLRGKKTGDDNFNGEVNGNEYPITDKHAAFYGQAWEKNDPGEVVKTILGNTEIWEKDLNQIPGFAKMVTEKLTALIEHGALSVLQNSKTEKTLSSNEK